MSDKPVRVDLEGCRCEGTPHHHDWVDLMPHPSIPMGSAVVAAVGQVGNDRVRMQAELARVYLGLGIMAWSFVEGDPQAGPQTPVPVQDWSPNIDKWLPWSEGGMLVAETADDLYSEDILRPWMSRLSKLLPGGPTEGLTSPTPIGSPTPVRPSKPSSRTRSGAGRHSGGRVQSRGGRRSSACR